MIILQALINGVLLGGVFAAFSAGMSLIFGVMGVLNIAHGELLMLGAFLTVGLFSLLGWDPFFSLPFCFLALALLGYLLQRLIINRVIGQPPVTGYLLTFGLHLILSNTALLAFSADPRAVTVGYSGFSLALGPFSLPLLQLAAFCLAVGVVAGLHLLLRRTALGRAIRATAQDAEMARCLGIDVPRTYAFTFALGAGVTGLAGGLLALIRPVEAGMGLPYTITAFCVVVLGGMGYLPGALIGGLVLGLVSSLSAVIFTSGLSLAITFFLLYLVLVFRPGGISGKGVAE